jgi:hypothetical protein
MPNHSDPITTNRARINNLFTDTPFFSTFDATMHRIIKDSTHLNGVETEEEKLFYVIKTLKGMLLDPLRVGRDDRLTKWVQGTHNFVSLANTLADEEAMWLPFAKLLWDRPPQGNTSLLEAYTLVKIFLKMLADPRSADYTPLRMLSVIGGNAVLEKPRNGVFKIRYIGTSRIFQVRHKWSFEVDRTRLGRSFDHLFDYLDKTVEAVDLDPLFHILGNTPRSTDSEKRFIPTTLRIIAVDRLCVATVELSGEVRYIRNEDNPWYQQIRPLTTFLPASGRIYFSSVFSEPIEAQTSNEYSQRVLSRISSDGADKIRLIFDTDGFTVPLHNYFPFVCGVSAGGKTYMVFNSPSLGTHSVNFRSYGRTVAFNITNNVVPGYAAYTFTVAAPPVNPGRPLNYTHRVENSLKTLMTPTSIDPLLGVELEVSSDYTYASMTKDWVVPKSDGSVGGSKTYPMELVTAPMTYSIQRRKWREFFSEFPDSGFCKETNNNGLHIHVAKRSFLSEDHFTNFVKFFLNIKNYTFLQVLSQRRFLSGSPGTYTGISTIMSMVYKEEAHLFSQCANSKYSPLGIKDETVECRIFNGYPTLGMMLLSLDFIGALFLFSYELRNTNKPVHISDFIKWLDTTQRSQYRALKLWWAGQSPFISTAMLNGITNFSSEGWVFQGGLMVSRPPISLPEPSLLKIKEIRPPKVVASCTLRDVPDGTVFRRNFYNKPSVLLKKNKGHFKIARSQWPISNQDRTA